MIQMFEKRIIPIVQTAFSKLLVLGDEQGAPLDADGKLLDASDFPTTLYFYASYTKEWLDLLTELNAKGMGYPFLYINTNGLKQEGTTYTIREMVLATQTEQKMLVEEKRERVVYPILFNLRDLLIEAMRDCFAVDMPFDPQTEVIYSEKEGSKLPEGVDAILFTNIKLRKIC